MTDSALPLLPILGLIATFAALVALVAIRPTVASRGRHLLLTAVLVISGAAAVSLYDFGSTTWRIALDPSEEPMIPSGDPGLETYADAIANFGNDDHFIIAMHVDDVFSAANLVALREIGDRVRRIPGVRSVESVVESTVPSYDADRDLFSVSRFVDAIPTDPGELRDLRERALAHPLFQKSHLGPDGRSAAINVAMRTMTDAEYVNARINEQIDTILAEHKSEERAFFVTGRQATKARAYHIMVHDLLTLIPVAVLVGAFVAWVATGSLVTGLLPVSASAIAMLWVFAYLAMTGTPLNIITLVIGPVLLCVGSVYGVHVIARYPPPTGDGATLEMEECIRRVRTPVILAGTTTIIGFTALATSTTPAIRELAALSVLGIATITLLSLTAIPAALSLVSADTRSTRNGGRFGLPRLIDAMLALFRRVAIDHSTTTLAIWSLLALGAIAALPAIKVDTDYLRFFGPSSRVRTDFAAIGNTLVGPVPLYVSLYADEAGAMREPGNLHALARLQDRIDAIDGVSTTLSAVDLLEQANRAFEYDDPKAAAIPDTKGEVADLFLVIPKSRMRPFANANQSGANIVVRTTDSGSEAIRELERQLHTAIDESQLPPGLRATVTGNSILLSHNADGIAANQVSAVSAAAIAIFVLVSLAMRSLTLGSLAMAPNIVPVLMFFGLLGCGIGTLSLPTSLLGCIALGIAVDDTAHFLVDYHRGRGRGLAVADAATACIRILGRPIIVTSLMLSAGFLVLQLSGFATLRELGRLAALTMFLCLCADLTLLPALLVRSRA